LNVKPPSPTPPPNLSFVGATPPSVEPDRPAVAAAPRAFELSELRRYGVAETRNNLARHGKRGPDRACHSGPFGLGLHEHEGGTMIRPLLAALAALMLTGCATQMTQEQIAAMNAADDAKCQEYGAKQGTPQYTQCRLVVSEQRRQDDRARREAIADALEGAGRGFQQRQPVNCTSNRMGTYTYTNCY
jgi:hypothetical protein